MNQLAEGFNRRMAKWLVKAIRPFCEGEYCLDVGAGKGDIGAEVGAVFKYIDAVEPDLDSAKYLYDLDIYSRIIPASPAEYTSFIWRDYPYDTVLLINVLEHMSTPAVELEAIKDRALAPNGVCIFVVPNANSLHRQIGVEMGIIEDTTQLQQHDLDVGHKRWYTPETLEAEVMAAGFTPEYLGGILLKTSPNSVMEGMSDEKIDAMYEVGLQYPEICSELLLVCRKK